MEGENFGYWSVDAPRLGRAAKEQLIIVADEIFQANLAWNISRCVFEGKSAKLLVHGGVELAQEEMRPELV
jgi:hypothetical protein